MNADNKKLFKIVVVIAIVLIVLLLLVMVLQNYKRHSRVMGGQANLKTYMGKNPLTSALGSLMPGSSTPPASS